MSFLSGLWQCGFDSYGILPRIRRMEVIKIMQFSRNKLKISYMSILTILLWFNDMEIACIYHLFSLSIESCDCVMVP